MPLIKAYYSQDEKDKIRKVVTKDGIEYENKYFKLTQPDSYGVISRLKGQLTRDKYRIHIVEDTTDKDLIIAQAESFEEIMFDWRDLNEKLLPAVLKNKTFEMNMFPELLMNIMKEKVQTNTFRRPSTNPSVVAERNNFENKLKKLDITDTKPEVVTKSKTLHDYKLYRTLGTGSFGRVMLCKDKDTDKYCALKIIKKEVVIRLKQVEHTANEINILQCIKHPFLIPMLDYFQDKKCLYLSLEYINGGEMFTHIHRNRYFSHNIARFYAAEIILALEYLHNLDIVYRDLKPENLLIDKAGHVRITDFGFAKRVTDKTWTLCGTPEYLAPEIILSKGYSHAVDWWAVGVLIYEMRCGHAPFYDQSQMEMYRKIVEGRLGFPVHFKHDEKLIISAFLTGDLTRRLGNMRGGPQQIKDHVYFKGLDWNALQTLQLPSPYIPRVLGDGDDSLFDKYDEEQISWHDKGEDPYEEIFKKF